MYHQWWDGRVNVDVFKTPWEFNGFVTSIDHEKDLRDPKTSTRIISERGGNAFMFIDNIVTKDDIIKI